MSIVVENISKNYGAQKALDNISFSIKRGEIVVVVDDENRENEGDLIMAAEKCTPENVGFIVRHTSGVLCVSLENSRLMVVQMILS